METTWVQVRPYIMRAIDSVIEFMKPYAERMLEVIGDQLNEWVYNLPGGRRILGAENPEDRAELRNAERRFRDARDQVTQAKKELDLAKARNASENEIRLLQNALDTLIYDVLRPAEAALPVRSKLTERHVGSLGATGNLFENWGSGTPVMLKGTEAVVTPEQMGGIVNNSLAMGVETLNNQIAELLRVNKEIAMYGRRNIDALASLNRDQFA